MSQPKITIAIDGFSSCGKSTLARDLAKKLGYIFIDSGAMYRGITLYALENGIISKEHFDKEKLIEELKNIQLKFVLNEDTQLPELYLNGKNVSKEIRTLRVSALTSKIATIKEVREKLVSLQQEMGKKGGIIMDGRDIGSVVFPDAEVKLFVTADVEERTRRRHQELSERGQKISKEEVKKNLQERDIRDATREESPLVKTNDAIVIDTTELSREEQLQKALEIVREKIKSLSKH